VDIYQKIESEMRAALKGRDAVRLSTLRMTLAAIKNTEIEKKASKLCEADILQVIQRQIKQRRESIEQFTKGNRPDLAEKEAKELKILEGYMPKQLTEAELLDIIRSTIAELKAATRADAGAVMRAVMEKVRGRADGKLVNQLVAGLLK
jgi:uncharacterized protein YqeY